MPTILDFDDLKSMLELENTDFDSYPDLELIADNVHSALENYCNRVIDFDQTLTETGFISDSTFLDVSNLPIISITSLVIGSDTLTSDDYDLDYYGLRLKKKYTDPYTIVVRGGFSEIPNDIYRAELSQTVYEYQQKNNIGTTNFSNSGGTTTSAGFVLLPEVKRLINKYCHPNGSGF